MTRKAWISFLLLQVCLGLSMVFSSFAAPPDSADSREVRESKVEIDRIEFLGLSVFAQNEIEPALQIFPGEKLIWSKVVRTAENLQALFRAHGYEQVGIQSKLTRKKTETGKFESVLEFQIDEGLPTRIRQFKFVLEGSAAKLNGDDFLRFWEKIQVELAQRLRLTREAIFDEVRINANKRSVQDLLASEEFVGARVEEVEVKSSVLSVMEKTGNRAARWVDVDIHVDLGDRVRFGFRGNIAYTAVQLTEIIEAQRKVGFGSDYIGAIRLRLEEEYHTAGYAHVKISPYVFENPQSQERHVTYVIQEGNRVKIESLDFDGNLVFSKEALRSIFWARAQKASVLLDHDYYVERDVHGTAELVIEWMKSQGYLAAKLVTITAVFPPQKRVSLQGSKVRLVVYLYEGEQTRVEQVRISGVSRFLGEEVHQMLKLRVGAPLNLYALSDGLEILKTKYRALGFLGVQILNEGTDYLVLYSEDNRGATIALEVSEGPQFHVGRIEIEGLSLTHQDVVHHEIGFKEGDVLSDALLRETEARLKRLGIFSVVSVRALEDVSNKDRKTVLISLQEGTPGIIAGGPGLRSDLGLRLFGQVGYTNLWGRNHSLLLNARVNQRFEKNIFPEYQAQLAYLWPWFAFPELLFRPTLTLSKDHFRTFDSLSTALALTLERNIVRKPNLTGVFTYSLERIKQFNARTPVPALDERDMTIGSVMPSLRLDMRDDPLSPSSGLYSVFTTELSAPWLYSHGESYPIGFWRIQSRNDYFVPVSKTVTWFFSFRFGWARNNEALVIDPTTGGYDPKSGTIPVAKQFALGGIGSLRGFAEQEINTSDKFIVGTTSYVNYRTQLEVPFSGSVRFGPFVDAGNIYVDRILLGQLRYSTGFGFHYQTPVGPVNAEWGFKVHPQLGEDAYRFHFSIGVI
ncbi:POTRA domain-containing protein [Bdellovibrionota bacterium FG-2]